MGYRSNVTIVFYTREKDRSRAAFIKAWLTEKGILPTVGNDGWGEIYFDEERGVKLIFTDTKWYESYPEVAAVMAAFKQFMTEVCEEPEDSDRRPSSTEYSCEFMRIGEEEDDIETERSDWHDNVLYLDRSIHAEF